MEKVEDKQRQLAAILDRGQAMLHLDARRPGVVVPSSLLSDFHARLNVSYRFDPQDLTLNDWGVRETLSFGGKPFPCAIPWSAIFAISSQTKVWVFPKDLPEELLGEFARAAKDAAAEPGLRLVPEEAAEVAEPSASPARPKLRLIKND